MERKTYKSQRSLYQS